MIRAGEPWWVLADICAVLEIAEAHRVASRLDADEKGRHTVTTPGGPQEFTIVNESGLWSLVLTSRKPEAKAFKKWLTSVVIPSLRQNGGYMVGQESMTDAERMASALLVGHRTISRKRSAEGPPGGGTPAGTPEGISKCS